MVLVVDVDEVEVVGDSVSGFSVVTSHGFSVWHGHGSSQSSIVTSSWQSSSQ